MGEDTSSAMNTSTRAILRISADLVMTILVGMKEGPSPRAFRVVGNGLPHDVVLVRAFIDSSDCLMLLLSSKEFVVDHEAEIHASGYPFLKPVVCEVARVES